MTNYVNDNLASGIFTTQVPGKRKRRGSRDVPERDKDSDFKPDGPPVSYVKKDEDHYRILSIYGPQEFKRDRR